MLGMKDSAAAMEDRTMVSQESKSKISTRSSSLHWKSFKSLRTLMLFSALFHWNHRVKTLRRPSRYGWTEENAAHK